MKRLDILVFAAMAILLCNCTLPTSLGLQQNPQQEPPVEEAAYITLDNEQKQSVSIGYEGEEFLLYFSTNKDWTIEVVYGSGASEWVSISANSGKAGKQALIATIQENTESVKRSAVITINAGDASENIVVSQEAFVSDFSISTKSFDVDAAGGTIEVVVTSNIGFHASTSVDWIHEMSTKATQTKSLWFVIDANESSEPRSGVIVICNDNEVCIPVTVNQAGVSASISISSNSLEFGYEGGESQISVTSNTDWTTECSADWCSVTPSSETGECTVTVKVKGNTVEEARSATVVFKTAKNSKTLTITQKPFEAIFDISTKSFDVEAAGGTIEVAVTANIGYHASTSVDWIREISTKAAQTKSLWFVVDANESFKARNGVIIICNDNEVCIPVTVNQAGVPASISVSPSVLDFSSQNGSAGIDIDSNTDWVVSEKPEWCTVSPASGSGGAAAQVSVTENGNIYPREGKIVLTAGGATAQVTVKQQSGQPELDVSDTEFSIPGNGDKVSFVIISNADWVINTGVSWLSASVTSGSGNAQITLTAGQNPDIKTRTAEVSVKTVDGGIRKTVTVTQSEGEVYLELGVYALEFDHQERRSEVKVTSNDSWNAVSSASWCTAEKSASGSSLNVCVKANDTGNKRTARITVKTDSGGAEKTLTISQSTPEENEDFGDDGQIEWD